MLGLGRANFCASAETIERQRRFYVDVVGLREGARPVFRSGSRGYWSYAGDRAVLHPTIARDGGASTQPAGAFNHLAFDCDDLDATCACLEKNRAFATKPILSTNCVKPSCS